jgi:hypothetical protein
MDVVLVMRGSWPSKHFYEISPHLHYPSGSNADLGSVKGAYPGDSAGFALNISILEYTINALKEHDQNGVEWWNPLRIAFLDLEMRSDRRGIASPTVVSTVPQASCVVP